ncbi:LLM class F420-dependent oxidoreductase [Saccharopolyspora sp. K220]|uniref:LLM class F420-dependent oxidoreductase n=1 Tax=Saccharopolyspora soli TaxID=2926618 RepID=UPI001F57CC25|nr:LLM class F420-dependent oxidoreductase [Saccharopolyspora soli]MCI2418380.1 LLM class F420-dependent oxidoreductase [Saccharopolyspora soli]
MSLHLGTFGAWLNPLHDDDARTKYAVEAEALGYGAAWLGFGTQHIEDLALVERILEATSTITVATAIVNMWINDATAIAKSYRRIRAAHGDRLLLGIGIGHPESVRTYRKPYDKMVDYLDELDDGGVPGDRRILAALGPRALELAAARTAGSHPYLVVADHTRTAREILGQNRILAPEQKVVLDSDADAARAIGRPFIQHPYLGLTNYVSNLRRHGYTEQDVADGGSDRLIDALSLHGTPEAIAAGLTAHLDAGADHVGIQVLTAGTDSPMPGFRELAEVLFGRANST